MDQDTYEEDNPNLDGDYKAVLKVRKLKEEERNLADAGLQLVNSGQDHQAAQRFLAVEPLKRYSDQSLRQTLFLLAESDDEETLRSYLQDKERFRRSLADYRYRDPESGETILHRALAHRSRKVAGYLLSTDHAAALAQATYDFKTGGEICKRSCIHQVTEMGDLDAVKRLLYVVGDPMQQMKLLYIETMYLPPGRRPRGVPCLHIAAMRGSTDIVEYLVSERGIDVNTKNEQKDTALMWAALEGKSEAVNLLVRLGADVNARNDQGSTALHYAIRYGHLEVAHHLIISGHADVNVSRKRGLVCPLVLAATMGFAVTVRMLIKSGANVNVRIHGGETALHYAAGEGHLDVCQALIEAGIKIEAADSKGETALIEAALHRQVDLVDYLVSVGANVNHVTLDRRSAWTFAVESSDNKMLNILLRHVSKALWSDAAYTGGMETTSMMSLRQNRFLHLPDSVTPLHQAAARGDTEKIQLMLDSQIDPDSRDSLGNTFLHVAASSNKWQVLQAFASSALASSVNDEGNTPLHEACKFCHDEAASILLEKTRLHEKNKSGRTALHEVARTSSAKASTARLLVAQIIQGHYWELLDAKDYTGSTALHLAVRNGNRAVLKELKAVNVRAVDEDGNTALHTAVAGNDTEAFAELLNLHSAREYDLNIANASGMTLDRLAIERHNLKILEYLIKAGADISQSKGDSGSVLHWITDVIKADSSTAKIYMQAAVVITDLAITWWTIKRNLVCPPAMSAEYDRLRAEAVRNLFAEVVDAEGLSVLEHSAKIGCVPMLEYIFNLKNVYKVKHGGIYEFDVTDLTPGTVIERKERANKVRPHEGESAESHSSPGSDGGRSLSLLELIVSNDDPLAAASVLSMQPISDVVNRYWVTYQWLYGVGMFVHLSFMVLLTAYAPPLLQSSFNGLNVTAAFLSGNTSLNCSEQQPLTPTQYILLAEPAILLLVQLFQLVSLAWRGAPAAAARRSKVFSTADRTAVIGPAILRLCGTIFALTTIAWLVMFKFCILSQAYVLSVALLFGWIFPLNLTSGFEALHQFSLMLRHMIFDDVFRFITVYAFVLFGFGFSQHVVLTSLPDYADYKIQETLFVTFQWLVGMNSFWDKPTGSELYNRYGFLAALYIFYTVISTIVLINLLIAMMSDSYREVKSHSALLWKVASIQLALDSEQSLGPLVSVFKRATQLSRRTDDNLTFDSQRNKWFMKLPKTRRLWTSKDAADANTSLLQLGQKVSAVQEQLESLAAAMKHLTPKAQDDLPAPAPIRRIENVARLAWKRAGFTAATGAVRSPPK